MSKRPEKSSSWGSTSSAIRRAKSGMLNLNVTAGEPSTPGTTVAAPSRWTVRVRDGAASVIAGVDGSPAITFKLSVPDFARLVAEQVEPQELLFSGRFDVEGDLTLATRVPEMFGAPPQF